MHRMVRLLQLGMDCCQANLRRRPSMYKVSLTIEGIMEPGKRVQEETGGHGVPFPEFERPEHEKEWTATEILRLADSTLTQHLEENLMLP